MVEVSRSRNRLMRARLLAGAAALGLSLLAAPALAQEPAPAIGADGLAQEAFFLEADEVIQNENDGLVTARGDVEVRYQGRTLRAQEVSYDRATGVVTASGQTAIINPDGTTQFADSITLDNQMRAGIATGFSSRLQGDVKIAAASAVRRSETVSELNKAIYTPCPVCVDDKGTHGPTWSIRADKVVQDSGRGIVYYRNATIRVFGLPIFYTPVFWHADPSVERQSGLLTPKIAASRRRGLSWEQPYLWVISPSQDLVINPQVNTQVNPFVNLAWRRRFENGQVNARVGYTYEADLRGDGERFGDRTSRSYILADGAFDIDPFWRWGFSAERTSDDFIFDKYNIENVYEQRGLFGPDDRRLTSQLYVTRQDQRSYLSVAAISIQGLRDSDVDRTFPLIAPFVEARFEPRTPVLGGRLRFLGSGVVLTREQSDALGSTRDDPGIDSRRATAEVDWRSNYFFANGFRVSPYANLRGDLYSIDDLPEGEDTSKGRLLGVAGLDLTYAFFRRDEGRTTILEPIAQIALSPESDPIVIGHDENGPIYFNEDSQALEFDETNLFRPNKFPGFDFYEGGLRLNAGGRATVLYDDGRRASLLLGRSFRAERDDTFPARSGLQTTSSDWIVATEIVPMRGIATFARARFDSDDGDLRRLEAGADVRTDRVEGFVRYLRDQEDLTGLQREDIDFAADVLVVGYWGLTVRGVRDIERDVWRRQEVGALYKDDCLDLRVVWVREEAFNERIGPSDSVQVRLSLATIGR